MSTSCFGTAKAWVENNCASCSPEGQRGATMVNPGEYGETPRVNYDSTGCHTSLMVALITESDQNSHTWP